MVELLIMRHAKSAWDTGDEDFFRPLSARGERDAPRMATWIAENDLVPDRVVSSAATRARSTALAVVFECAVDRSQVDFERDLYMAGAGQWLGVIREQSCQRLLVCGHNPGLDDLVDVLSVAEPALSSSGKLMTTAAVAHLRFTTHDWSSITARSGQLVDLVRPRELN